MLAVENGVLSFLLTAGCEGKAQLGQASRNHEECKVRFRRGKRTHTPSSVLFRIGGLASVSLGFPGGLW